MKYECKLGFFLHQIKAVGARAVGARTSRKKWISSARASSLYVTPYACLITKKPKATN